MTPRSRKWRAAATKPRLRASKGGLRTLPIAEYEAQYGYVGDYQHIEGGIVEFVLEGTHARFIRVTKDGQPYNKLRVSEKDRV